MKIITLVDQNEEFIKIQKKTLETFVENSFEYIVFNNGRTEEQKEKIRNICSFENINCIDINPGYYDNPSDIVSRSLNTIFNYVLKDYKDKIVYIDSDMFVFSKINFENMFENKSLIYVPNYKGPSFQIKHMWSGFFGIDFSKVSQIDFGLGMINGIATDVMGKTYHTVMQNHPEKLLNMYTLFNSNGDNLETNFDGCCKINFSKDSHSFSDYHISENCIYPHEIPREDYMKDLKKIYENLSETFSKYDFPKPYNIDIISYRNHQFVLHFKSSNWCPWYNVEYVNSKKSAIFKFLTDKMNGE